MVGMDLIQVEINWEDEDSGIVFNLPSVPRCGEFLALRLHEENRVIRGVVKNVYWSLSTQRYRQPIATILLGTVNETTP